MSEKKRSEAEEEEEMFDVIRLPRNLEGIKRMVEEDGWEVMVSFPVDAKEDAISTCLPSPLPPLTLDNLFESMERIAAKYGIEVSREELLERVREVAEEHEEIARRLRIFLEGEQAQR